MPESGLRVTPEQLIALNDEIAMLVRSGVPLELGLRELHGSVPSALGRISSAISQRMEEGQPLTTSLSETLPGLPRVYTAVIDAGLKSGNLPRALESLSKFAQQGLELRHRIEFAFLYPLFVFLLSYVLFLTFIIQTAPHWQQIWGEFTPITNTYVNYLSLMSQSWPVWAWIPPTLVAVLVLWWIFVARYSFLPDRRPSGLLHLIPGLAGIIELWHWANFCELLAMLLEHQIPLPTAMNLAADATGNSKIHEQMSAVSEELKTGKSMADCLRHRTWIPPYLRWSLGTAHQPEAFQSALRNGVELYRSRATFRADMIKMFLPLILVIAVGFGPVAFYARSLALPLRALFEQLNIDGMK
jgi:general secretion pathway protein F